MRRATLAAVVCLAGCAGDDAPTDSNGRPTPAPRSFAYVHELDLGARTARIDRAEFLTGEAANRAARADGAIAPDETVPNDYYVRNDDRSLETVPLADIVVVTRVHCNGGCREGLPGRLRALAASFESTGVPTLADDYRGPHSQYWLTFVEGAVTRIDEQYVP